MSLIAKLKLSVQSVTSDCVERVNALERGRERNKLLSGLGELTYREHRGELVDQPAIENVLRELGALDPIDQENLGDETRGESAG